MYELYLAQEGDIIAPANSRSLFNGYTKLTKIDLSYLDTSNVTDMNHMFYGNSKIMEINMSNFNFEQLNSFYNMLGHVLLSSQIIVKDNDTRNWILTNISGDYTDIVTVDELQYRKG